MTADPLIPWWYNFAVVRYPKCQADVRHFLLYRISPQGIPILLIKFVGLLDCHRNLDTKLEALFQVLGLSPLYKFDDPFPLPQDEVHPPIECRFAVNTLDDGILCHLQRIRLLQVLKCLPGRTTIKPLNTKVPANCGSSHGLLAIMRHVLRLFGQGFVAFLVVNDGIEQQVFVAIVIAHSIHRLSNGIGRELRNLAIRELNFVGPSVLDGIRVSMTNQNAFRVPFPIPDLTASTT